jgi:enolase
LDVVGAPNVLQAVPGTENCNLVVVQSFTQTDVGDFAHSTSAILTANGTDNSMKMGSAVSLSTGYASYMNASADGAALDYFQGEPVSFTLDTASALVMTGVTAAAVAVVSF